VDREFGFYSDSVIEEIKAKDESVDGDINASGLVRDSRWKGRIVHPWRDHRGKLATIWARDITGKPESETGPKYLYLHGGEKPCPFLLREALSQGGRKNLVLVEGVIDALRFHHEGLQNVAALGGLGASVDMLKTLKKERVQSVTLSLDWDPREKNGELVYPGLDATRRTVKEAIKIANVDNVPYVYVIDPKKLQEAAGKSGTNDKVDPDSLVTLKGLDAFRAVLKTHEPGATFLALDELAGVSPESDNVAKDTAVDRVVDLIDSLRGPRAGLEADELIRLLSERTGKGPEALADRAQSHAERKAKEEREKGLDRALEQAQRERVSGKPVTETLATLRSTVDKLSVSIVDEPPAFSVERLERESHALPAGKPSGWEAVDELGVQFSPGELTVVGARTGHGKTSFLVGLLANWLRKAEEEDGGELYVMYSHEEPEVRIYHRLLGLLTTEQIANAWDSNEIRDFLRAGYDSRPEYGWPSPKVLEQARERLKTWESRLLIVNRGAWDVGQIAGHTKNLKERYNVAGVLVDYLQRVPAPEGSYDRRDIEISTVGRALKALAVDISAPVVVGAQVNREAVPTGYGGMFKEKPYAEALEVIQKARPELNQLREGGSEQEADLVLGLLNYAADYRTEVKSSRPRPDITRFEVGTLKNRYGEVGQWAKLAFHGRYHLLRDPIVAEGV